MTDEDAVDGRFRSWRRANSAALDILVANAGIASAAPIEETTLEHLAQEL